MVDPSGQPAFATLEEQTRRLCFAEQIGNGPGNLFVPQPLFDGAFVAPLTADRSANRFRVGLSEWSQQHPDVALERIVGAFRQAGFHVEVSLGDTVAEVRVK